MKMLSGFTLGDLLVALGVVSILSVTAVPGFANLLLDARVTRHVNGFVHAVHLARQASTIRLEDTVICKTRDALTCAHNAAWHDGWLLFVNTDGDHPPHIDTGEPTLASGAAWPDGNVSANRRFFVFRPLTIRSTNGTVTFCDRRGAPFARAVIVSYSGRPRTARTGPGNRALICQM
ncbi:MAG: GspH/FimT family pseudopilin [Gammaproteobacteria bacterium]